MEAVLWGVAEAFLPPTAVAAASPRSKVLSLFFFLSLSQGASCRFSSYALRACCWRRILFCHALHESAATFFFRLLDNSVFWLELFLSLLFFTFGLFFCWLHFLMHSSLLYFMHLSLSLCICILSLMHVLSSPSDFCFFPAHCPSATLSLPLSLCSCASVALQPCLCHSAAVPLSLCSCASVTLPLCLFCHFASSVALPPFLTHFFFCLFAFPPFCASATFLHTCSPAFLPSVSLTFSLSFCPSLSHRLLSLSSYSTPPPLSLAHLNSLVLHCHHRYP